MILQINDPHATEKAPGERTDEYYRLICLKLLECAKIANQYCVAAVIPGDIFHHKIARNVTHYCVRILIMAMKKFKVPVYIVRGNHDIFGGQIKTTTQQPVGVLLEAGVASLLKKLIIPEADLEVLGFDYDQAFEDGIMKIHLPEKETGKRLIFMHQLLSPGSRLRDNIVGPFDLCCYGHPHMEEGHVGKFANFGSLARTTKDKYNRRDVKVAMIEPNLTVLPIQLKNQKPWTEIYKETTEDSTDERAVEEFLDAMEQAEGESADDLETFLAALRLPVRRRVTYFIGSA